MSEIKICTHCDGEGSTSHRHRFDGYVSSRCSLCNGSGRIMERIYTLILPFNHEIREKYYALDSEIHKKIRDLTTYEKENRLSDFVDDLTEDD